MKKLLPVARRLLQVKWLGLIVVVAVVGLTAVLVVTRWDEVVAFPWRIHPGYLALTVLLHSLALGVTFVVWHLMVAHLGGFKDWVVNFRIYYVSTLAKRVPTSLPFIGGRLMMYRQVGVPGAVVLNCILLETLLIGLGGVLTLLALAPFYPRLPAAVSVVFAVPAALLLGLLFLRPSAFFELTNRVLRRFKRNTLDRFPSRQDVAIWTGLYVLPWIFAGASFYCAPLAFSASSGPSLLEATLISTVSMLVSLGSLFMPSGFGLREIAYTVLMSPWLPIPASALIALAYRLTQTVNEILWAVFALAVTGPQDNIKEMRGQAK